MASEPSDLYYNARLTQTTNGITIPGYSLQPASFSDFRPGAIITKPSLYRMACIQFNVSCNTLPLLYIDHPKQTGTTPTQTSYNFTIKDVSTGYSSTVGLVWTPEENVVQQSGDLNDPYWYCFDPLYFVNIANTALTTAMANIITHNGAYVGVPPPQFSYNTQTAVISIYYPRQFIDSANQLQLFANELTYILFQGFPAYGDNTQPSSMIWQYSFVPQVNETLQTIGSNQYYIRSQIPGALTSWNPVCRIVFTTSVPLAQEASTPQTDSAGNQLGSGLAQQIVLADFVPIITRGDELATGSVYYSPSAEYRFSDVISDTPLNRLDFQVFWQDKYGGNHLLTLSHNGFIQAKLLFRNKEY